MNIKNLNIFVMVCREGSITKAAEKLFMTQPAVSRTISELEKHYQTKLFDRISGRLYITNVGETFLTNAERILSDFNKLEYDITNSDYTGSFKVGCSLGIGIVFMHKFVSEFNNLYPNIKIEVTENHSGIVEDMVLANELDIAFIEGISGNNKLQNDIIYNDELLLVCGKSHPLASEPLIDFKSLTNYDLIIPHKGSGTRKMIDAFAEVQGIVLNPAWSTVNYLSIISSVIDGNYLTLLSKRLLQDYIANGSLIHIPLNLTLPRHYYCVYHKTKYLTTPLNQLIKVFTKISNS